MRSRPLFASANLLVPRNFATLCVLWKQECFAVLRPLQIEFLARGPENGVVGMSEPGSLAHCVDDNCDVNGNSCSRAGHVHQESPAASLLNGGDTVSA